MSGIGDLNEYLEKAGPYIGPHGGKYADPQHKIPYKEGAAEGGEAKPDKAPKGAKPKKLSATHRKVLYAANKFQTVAPGGSFATYAQVDKLSDQGLLEAAGHGQYKLTEAGKTALSTGSHTPTKKSMSGVELLEDYLEKAGGAAPLPTGQPTMGGSGEEQGGKLEGVGKNTGGNTSAAQQTIGAPGTEKKKLSEDDEEVEDQLKDSDKKKPLERTTKSLNTSPQGQRDQVAYERALAIDRARRVQDVTVGVGVRPPAPPAGESMTKSRTWQQGSEARVVYSDAADLAVERLSKSESFYVGGSPNVSGNTAPLRNVIRCRSCEHLMVKALTTCPHCGDKGAASPSLAQPARGVSQVLTKSAGPIFRQARPQPDLYLPNGVSAAASEE